MILKINKNIKRVGKILFRIVLVLVLLEVGLRIGGWVHWQLQESRNRVSLDDIDAYRILTLGDSFTYGMEDSWPEQLEGVLNERSKSTKFRVFNKARVGESSSATLLSTLEDDLTIFKPNLVIVMIGIADPKESAVYRGGFASDIASFVKNMRVVKFVHFLGGNLGREEKKKMTRFEADYYKLNNTMEPVRNRDDERIGEALLAAESMLAKYPNSTYVIIESGLMYLGLGLPDKAIELFDRALYLDYQNSEISFINAYVQLAWYYIVKNQPKKAEEVFRKVGEINPAELADIYGQIIGKYEELGMQKRAEKLSSLLLELRNNIYNPVTQQNYQKIYNIISKKGIPMVAMQYPTLSAGGLKQMLSGNDGVVFISNEENFEEALEKVERDDLFKDRGFGVGHCTPKGNKLIAENVADVILEELDIE